MALYNNGGAFQENLTPEDMFDMEMMKNTLPIISWDDFWRFMNVW